MNKSKKIVIFAGSRKAVATRRVFPCKPDALRPYQDDIIERWTDHYFVKSPTGSGKSLTIITKAAMDRAVGISTFILIPKLTIVDSFDQTDNKKFQIKSKFGEFKLPPETIEHVRTDDFKSDKIVQRLEECCIGGSFFDPCIVVCCYETFKRAYLQIHKKLDNSKLRVIIDEAHHSMMCHDKTALNMPNLLLLDIEQTAKRLTKIVSMFTLDLWLNITMKTIVLI